MANEKSYTDYLMEEQSKAQATEQKSPGYAEYLAGLAKATGGGQKQVTSAAPTPAGQGYADWLVTMQKNHKVENTPTNAMSYTDYLLYMGTDPTGSYKAAVKEANQSYADATHAYGKNKEAMVGAGLAGSGYGEYLLSTAYAERARAIENAQETAKTGMEQGMKGYANYLTQLRSANEEAAYTGIVSGLLTGDKAKQYAIDKGVTEDRLETILEQANAAVQPTVEQNVTAYIQQHELTGDDAKKYALSAGMSAERVDEIVALTDKQIEQVRAQNSDAAFNQLLSLMSEEGGNMSFSTAIQTMQGGTYKDYIGDITERYAGAELSKIDLALKEGYVVAGTLLDRLKNNGAIDDTKYNEYLTKVQGHNGDVVKAIITGKNVGLLAKYAEANGLTAPSSTDQADAVIDHMVEAGVLSNESRQEYYKATWVDTIADDGSASDLIGCMNDLQASRTEGQISHEQYVALLEEVGNRCESMYGKVESPLLKTSLMDSSDEVRVSYTQGDLGMEDIQITAYMNPYNQTENEIKEGTEYFIEGQRVNVSSEYTKVKGACFGTIGGKPVLKIEYTHGVYNYKEEAVKYFDILASDEDYTDHDNAFLAYMCTP